MADDMHAERLKRIETAITGELERQSLPKHGGIDIAALAIAIDVALHGGAAPGEAPVEGPTPAELNSSNDG